MCLHILIFHMETHGYFFMEIRHKIYNTCGKVSMFSLEEKYYDQMLNTWFYNVPT